MASLINQICFTDEADCIKFKGHMLKPNICINCSKDISKHNSLTVSADALTKALETTQNGERIPSQVLSVEDGLGKLYLGGFKAALNTHFLKQENVTGVLNVAGEGLFQLFGKKLQETYEKAMKSNDVKTLFMPWQDSISYDISLEDMKTVIGFIHETRQTSNSVLVHCAQGKSRSTTAVVAYLMVVKKMSVHDALAVVKNARKMAEPNIHFMLFLSDFEKSGLLKELRKEYGYS